MLDKEQISIILETYDLDQRVKEKIRRIVIRRIDELDLGSFDKAYEYIANLVEKFQTPFMERYF